MSYYKNKKIWITGASSGIGRALAQAASEQGAFLILSARSKSKLLETQSSLQHPEKSEIIILDMGKPEEISSVTQQVLAKHDIDILINNAGISQRSLAMDTDMTVNRQLMEINYFGVIQLSQCLLPAMIKRKAGHIVSISSVNGKLGSYMKSGYAASKHALHGYFDSLRAEISDSGVKITLITPGYVQSSISVNALTADGTPQQSMDDNTAKGIPAIDFARKALKKISKGKNEIAIAGGIETLALWLKRLAPNLLHKMAANRKEA